MCDHTWHSIDQPGKVANIYVRGQLNRENKYFTVPVRAREFGLARRFGSPVPRQPAHLHIQTESGAYLRDSCRFPRRRPFMYFKPSYAIGSIPRFSGHAIIAYRWRELPRVHRHRGSKRQRSSKRVLPWQVTMDKIICASLSHTHYWYKVDILNLL